MCHNLFIIYGSSSRLTYKEPWGDLEGTAWILSRTF